MTKPPDPRTVLDYSAPRPIQRGSNVRLRDVVVAVCILSAIGLGFASYVQFSRRFRTPQYAQYRIAEARIQSTQPAYVAPRFVGRKYKYESPWDIWTSYCAIVATLVGFGIIIGANVRSRKRG